MARSNGGTKILCWKKILMWNFFFNPFEKSKRPAGRKVPSLSVKVLYLNRTLTERDGTLTEPYYP